MLIRLPWRSYLSGVVLVVLAAGAACSTVAAACDISLPFVTERVTGWTPAGSGGKKPVGMDGWSSSGSFLDKLIMVDRKITKSISDLG